MTSSLNNLVRARVIQYFANQRGFSRSRH
jgi:hypothetical protein